MSIRSLSRMDWEKIVQIKSSPLRQISCQHVKKFEKLVDSVFTVPLLDVTQTGLNLSSKELDPVMSLKRLNFAIAPWRLLVKEIICGVEQASGGCQGD